MADSAARPSVTTFALDALKAYEGNARKHSARQLAQLRESIRRFGFNAQIAVWRGGVIMAGHGRVEAARAEGLIEVPGVDLSAMDFTEARAFCLADNRIADMASWDEETLAGELTDLHELGVDMAGTGFGANELAKLIADFDLPLDLRSARAAAPAAGPDAGDEDEDEDGEDDTPGGDPLLGPPVAALGDVWTMGGHVLVVGSSADPGVVAQACPPGRAALLLTDPPYGVDYGAKNRDINKALGRKANETDIASDALPAAELEAFLTTVFEAAAPAVRPGGAVYVFSAPGDLSLPVMLAMFAAGLPPRHGLIWVKERAVLGCADYNYRHELLHYGWKPGAAHAWHGPTNEESVWECPRPRSSKAHPTMKPEALLERAIRNSTVAGETVLDVFAGSGSTMVAAHNRGRCAALVELEPKFADVILRRAIAELGLEPVRGDGVPFARAAELAKAAKAA